MNLNVKITENLITFETIEGKSFNLDTNSISSDMISAFTNFIKEENAEYERNCKYKLHILYDPCANNPRVSFNNLGTMIGFGHRHDFDNQDYYYEDALSLMEELADNYDSKTKDDLSELFDNDEISESEYFYLSILL